MSDELERRAYTECRIAAVDGRRMQGYPIVFNAQSVDLGGFREIISPEAVDRTLQEAIDVRALVDHDAGKVIGRLRSGTLSLQKDAYGLRATIEPDPEITYARDIMLAVKRGDVSGMSFGFRVVEDDWNYEGPTPIRTVLDMRVSEVSIVSFPAYQQTDVQVAQRSLQEYRTGQRRSAVAFRRRQLQTTLAQ